LSRGYGGETHAAPLLVDPQRHSARVVGDEPLLLARVAPCFVGADRVAAARAAIEACASVLVMDDGLQNPQLVKDFSIAVIDGEARFGNGLCLPAGPLRAPLQAQAPFVDALVVIGGDAPQTLASVAPGRPLFAARLSADAAAASRLVGRPVLAFAGIARPEKFFASLEGIGAHVARKRAFPDHHPFRAADIAALLAEADKHGLIAVTTEKDRVRFPPGFGDEVATLPVRLGFDDVTGFSRRLANALAAARKR
jgi:tetraacyldisaccharide 4'-kinase